MKRTIGIANHQLCQSMCMVLLLLFFTTTYTGMISLSIYCRDELTRLARFLFAVLPSMWLYVRFQRIMQKPSLAKPDIGFVSRLLALSMRPHLTMLGLWMGGSLCLLFTGSPVLGWLFGGLFCSINYNELFTRRPVYQMQFLRGSFILTIRQVRYKLRYILKRGERLLNWAGLPFPERFSSGHFFILGAIGSGKTVLLRLLLQSIVPGIKPGSNWRMVINDPKKEMLGLLSGMMLQCRVIVLNPFDTRFYSWAMAKDINSPVAATQMAHALIKEEKGENAFFVKAARDLMSGVIQALIISRPGEWTLAELLRILSDRKQVKDLLWSVPETHHFADEHFKRDDRTLNNVFYTITANVSTLRCVAALYEKSERQFSLQDWLDDECILVLGHDERLREPINAINRLLMDRMAELLLSQSESDTRRTWIVLDELEETCPYPSLAKLLTEGRSKGVRGILGTQLVEGLRDSYGKDKADKIIAICGNKAFLRTDSSTTSQLCAEVLGKVQVRKQPRGFIMGRHNNCPPFDGQDVTEDLVLASQLMRLPQANRKRFYGYFVTQSIGLFSGPVFFAKALRQPGNEPNFLERADKDQYLSPSSKEGPTSRHAEIDLMDIRRVTHENLFGDLEDDDQEDYDNDAEEGGFNLTSATKE